MNQKLKDIADFFNVRGKVESRVKHVFETEAGLEDVRKSSSLMPDNSAHHVQVIFDPGAARGDQTGPEAVNWSPRIGVSSGVIHREYVTYDGLLTVRINTSRHQGEVELEDESIYNYRNRIEQLVRACMTTEMGFFDTNGLPGINVMWIIPQATNLIVDTDFRLDTLEVPFNFVYSLDVSQWPSD